MTYSVKEIYYTLQGEGHQTGRPAVFVRFTGCNLWTGREADRASAVCRFCDTDFVGTGGPGGGRFEDTDSLVRAIVGRWPRGSAKPFVVATGGEPLLQLDGRLIEVLHAAGAEIAVETNGTIAAPPGIDWVCVSPKSGTDLVQRTGDELKLVFPQPGADPGCYVHLPFQHHYLQPMDGPDLERNTAAAIEYCRANPRWKLSVQTHKLLGIP